MLSNAEARAHVLRIAEAFHVSKQKGVVGELSQKRQNVLLNLRERRKKKDVTVDSKS
jgi:hypothetical protein